MRRHFIITIALTIAALTAQTGVTHENVTGPVGERMRAMSDMGKTLKTLHQAAKQRELMGNEEMSQHIEQLLEKANAIPELFSEPATMPLSDALPDVWEDAEEFNSIAAEFSAEVKHLQILHRNGDRSETLNALKTVTRECVSCHDAFRE